MPKKASVIRNLSDWSVQTLRLTVFTPSPTDEVNVELWQKLTGQAPENIQSQPLRGANSVEGEFGKGRLALAFDPSRVDWIYSVNFVDFDKDSESIGLPTIGPFDSELEFFQKEMSEWIKQQCPPVNRMAFGALLNLPVDTREAGYRVLVPYLKESVKLDPKGTSEFSYRINRPVDSKSTVAGLRINRLSNWSVRQFISTKLSLGSRPQQPIQGSDQLHCHLELDINTRPEFQKILPKSKRGLVFGELVELSKEIVEKGDV